MKESVVSHLSLPEFLLWKKIKGKRTLLSFDLEITARCSNNCQHCYINLPAGDKAAKKNELAIEEIDKIADEAISLGALWCLLTGGDPLLREDFFDIYLSLKKKGLLVSVFTAATLITAEHVRLFKKYPPRALEVSVYGATKETYEGITRKPGSFAAFRQGLDLLVDNGIKVTLKAMALRSNIHEMSEIARFCHQRTQNAFRFDPFVHLRFDGNPYRNNEIKSQRLTAEEIVTLEQSDTKRFQALQKECIKIGPATFSQITHNKLFGCGAGNKSLTIGHDGRLRLCSSLWHPDCVYDLRNGSLSHAWRTFFPRVRVMQSGKQGFVAKCRCCPLINLCMWCPAHAYLETGELDMPVEYFCEVAHAREKALRAYENANEVYHEKNLETTQVDRIIQRQTRGVCFTSL
jgi:radical SAM protein with 4Fe4S-binding SPASM domain